MSQNQTVPKNNKVYCLLLMGILRLKNLSFACVCVTGYRSVRCV